MLTEKQKYSVNVEQKTVKTMENIIQNYSIDELKVMLQRAKNGLWNPFPTQEIEKEIKRREPKK